MGWQTVVHMLSCLVFLDDVVERRHSRASVPGVAPIHKYALVARCRTFSRSELLCHLFEPLYCLTLWRQRIKDCVQWGHFGDLESEHAKNQNEFLIIQELTSSLHASVPLDEAFFEILESCTVDRLQQIS